jgi:hypothetical protein
MSTALVHDFADADEKCGTQRQQDCNIHPGHASSPPHLLRPN